jgi:hypothetical protein
VATQTADDVPTARATMACGKLSWDQPEVSGRYLAQSVDLARRCGDRAKLNEALGYGTFGGFAAGMRTLAEDLGPGRASSSRRRVGLGRPGNPRRRANSAVVSPIPGVVGLA